MAGKSKPAAPSDPVDISSDVEDAPIAADGPAIGSRTKYVIKHMFTPTQLHKVSQLFRKAVYSKPDIPSKKKAVMAVLYHGLDYPDSSIADKIRYHQHCGDWCYFIQWQDSDQPLEDLRKTTTKDSQGNVIPWTGGVYANLDLQYPDAFNKLKAIFENQLASEGLLSRTQKAVTQNSNESSHQKVWNMVKKCKKHKYTRINFACMHVVTENNFGKQKASLFHKMGGMTLDAKILLKNSDKASIRVAKRRYELKDSGVRQNRKKTCYTSRGEEAYSPGGEDVSDGDI